MRIVSWNCNMAMHRKADALLALKPDIAVVSECAEPFQLGKKSQTDWLESEPVWIGQNPAKGLAVFGFNGYHPCLSESYSTRLRYVAPVHISGPNNFNLLAVWAQNASAGITRKRQPGPLRLALSKYREFLTSMPSVVAGDWNSNAIWDKPGWRINHMAKVDILARMGLVSAYHEITGDQQGQEIVPTLYWRNRTKYGPTYHIDYIFMPRDWVTDVEHFSIGSFEEWCGNGLSDHVPIVLSVNL